METESYGYAGRSCERRPRGYTTVEDLQKFASALLNHKLLMRNTRLLTTGHAGHPRGVEYRMDSGQPEDGARSSALRWSSGDEMATCEFFRVG